MSRIIHPSKLLIFVTVLGLIYFSNSVLNPLFLVNPTAGKVVFALWSFPIMVWSWIYLFKRTKDPVRSSGRRMRFVNFAGFVLLALLFAASIAGLVYPVEAKTLQENDKIKVVEYHTSCPAIDIRFLTCYRVVVPGVLGTRIFDLTLEDAANNYSIEHCTIKPGNQIVELTISDNSRPPNRVIRDISLSRTSSIEGNALWNQSVL